jgi:Ca2+-binding RTX toxin-like protein
MAVSLFRHLFGKSPRKQVKRSAHQNQRTIRPLESLEERELMAVTASFLPSAGTLSVFGDNLSNNIEISRDAAGVLRVNGGAVVVKGGTPTVANTTLVQVFGQGGSDNITMNEASGALPRANIFGGTGNDTLIGGSGADMLFGQSDDDNLQGKGGNDSLFGGANADVLNGGDADDQVFGEAGSDRMVWNPGDDTDLNEGGNGNDTVEVNGGNGSEQFTATANGARVRFDRLVPAPFSIDIGTSENLVVNMNGGDDSFSATGNLAALIQITVDGGTGNDTVLGGNGADLLRGGDGNDFMDGNQGNDNVQMGAGDDVFQWDPGDGSDVVEGQANTDTMQFNGSAIAEIFEASANGGRLRFTRNIGNIVMDVDDVERVNLEAVGGADTVRINDLSSTDVTEFNVNLAGALGGTAGDGVADTVTVTGTNGNDIIDVFGSGTSYSVVGLHTLVTVANSEGANDALVINALGGNDGVTASTLPAGIVKLTIDGGTGNDSILGSRGADLLVGGDGEDFIDGQAGDDTALMGAGDDIFQWDPGDGSDTIEGQGGSDLMFFFGANINENIDISANGGRVRFFRDVASVTMDMDDVERIEFRALGGADTIVIGDLSGTDVTDIGLDLRGPNGGGDGAADSIVVNGTQNADSFGAAGDSGGISVFGLHAHINIFDQEQALDRLTLNGQAGDDVMDAISLEADGIQLTMNGGLGNDVFHGSEGNDLINGGDGNDVAFMNAGDDVFVWNPGDDNDTVEGQDGSDAMLFNGANIAESIDVSANGNRVRFFRNVANVVMDLGGVESITFNAFGGADLIAVNDMSGTDLTEVNLNLAANGGGGDLVADTITVSATNGEDVAVVVGDASGVSVFGMSTVVNITGAEALNDRLTLNMLAGADVMEASGVAAGSIQLTADGGTDDDILIGGEGADVLLGGEGDDVLIGNGGNDVLDGGPGDNVVIQ